MSRPGAVATAGTGPTGTHLGLFGPPMVLPVTCGPDWQPPRPALDFDEHLARYGPLPGAAGRPGDTLLATLDEIALTGRGGGHFPAATKWRTVREHASADRPPIVVANAAEGEPASAKDRALLARHPHLVLDGLFSAGAAIGATDLVVWLHDDAVAARVGLTRALTQRAAAGQREPAVRLVTGAHGYLGGESSAVVGALSGGSGLPTFSRVPAAVRGVHGRPTLVHNVETLARVALAARTGPVGYRDSVLVTVLGEDRRTVLELDPGTRIAQAVRLGWVSERPGPRAVLLGGYGGSWLPWGQAAGLALAEPVLRAAGLSLSAGLPLSAELPLSAGLSLGAGLIAPLPAGACALAEVAAVAGYLAGSGAGQCGPCLFGLPAIAAILADLAAGRAGRGDLRRLERYLGEVAGRGACHHPDGLARFAASALRAFPAEVIAHRRRGRPCAGWARQRLLPVPGRA